MKNKLYIFLLLLFLLSIIFFPAIAFEGSVEGLLLWFHTVLPTLLPFVIITGILLKLDIIYTLTRFIHPAFKRLLHLSPMGCYGLICGILCGYPMGAKTASQLIKAEKISKKEGQFLLGISNNISPAFFLNYVASQTLHISFNPFFLLAFLYLMIFIYAFITRPEYDEVTIPQCPDSHIKLTFQMLDESIMDGFETITRLGGYIILFAIIAKMATALFPAVTILSPFTIGIIEITNGCKQFQQFTLPLNISMPLIFFLCSFGGICGIAQTQSMIQGTALSIRKYIFTKIVISIFAMLSAYIVCTLYSKSLSLI